MPRRERRRTAHPGRLFLRSVHLTHCGEKALGVALDAGAAEPSGDFGCLIKQLRRPVTVARCAAVENGSTVFYGVDDEMIATAYPN